MAALAGSLYLVSTIAFCAICLVVGVRLVARSRSGDGRPELLLGTGIGLTGGVGYGLLIAVALTRLSWGQDQGPGYTFLTAFGRAVHDVGVLCVIAFVLQVFRPGVAWARGLAAVMVAALVAGYVGNGLAGGFVHGRAEGAWYWVEFATIAGYPVWASLESLAYYARMRRRRALGLADPLVTNRFLVWGIAFALTFAAIITVSFPALIGLPLAEQQRVAPVSLLLTAVWGTGSVAAQWLTFFPPRWYRAWVVGRAAAVR